MATKPLKQFLLVALLAAITLAAPTANAADEKPADPPITCEASYKSSAAPPSHRRTGWRAYVPRFGMKTASAVVTGAALVMGAYKYIDTELDRDRQARALTVAISDPATPVAAYVKGRPAVAGRALRMLLSPYQGNYLFDVDEIPTYWEGWDLVPLLQQIDIQSHGVVTRAMTEQGIDPVLMHDGRRWQEFEDLYSHRGDLGYGYVNPNMRARIHRLDKVLGAAMVWLAESQPNGGDVRGGLIRWVFANSAIRERVYRPFAARPGVDAEDSGSSDLHDPEALDHAAWRVAHAIHQVLIEAQDPELVAALGLPPDAAKRQIFMSGNAQQQVKRQQTVKHIHDWLLDKVKTPLLEGGEEDIVVVANGIEYHISDLEALAWIFIYNPDACEIKSPAK